MVKMTNNVDETKQTIDLSLVLTMFVKSKYRIVDAVEKQYETNTKAGSNKKKYKN